MMSTGMLKYFLKIEHKFNHVLPFKYQFRFKPHFLEISMTVKNLIILFSLRHAREPEGEYREKAMFKSDGSYSVNYGVCSVTL